MLVSHVLVPPALGAILDSSDCRVQAFLGPGHVCAVMGYADYEPIAERWRVPIVVTGFEPVDLLQGVLMAVRQLEEGRAVVENQYSRILGRQGNPAARALVDEVFEVADRKWRGIGAIPRSGYRLRDAFRAHDAEARFDASDIAVEEPAVCISGRILKGVAKPPDCAAFGSACTPEHPLGATMVSSEGACAAYHGYGRHRDAGGGVGGLDVR
jgi:hydrogenase expression/formation protein HypD